MALAYIYVIGSWTYLQIHRRLHGSPRGDQAQMKPRFWFRRISQLRNRACFADRKYSLDGPKARKSHQ